MLFDDTAPEKTGFQNQTWSEENDPAEHFSAVSLSAILALLCAIASLFYLINRTFRPIPVAALGLSLFALWRIRRAEGRLTGGAMARAALTLALVVLVAVPVRTAIYQRQLIRQGKEFFSLVLEAAQRGDSAALSQFKRFQTARETINDEVAYWRGQLNDPMAAPGTVQLLGNKVLMAIYLLGENAKITYCRTADIGRDEKHDSDSVCMIYAVTYSEHGEKKTFLVPFYGARLRDKKNGATFWKCPSYPKQPLPLKGTSE